MSAAVKPCLICAAPVEAFMSFGRMPLANGFLAPGEFDHEYFFELRVAFCETCGMVQLMEQPERERMFHADYPFFSSSSRLQAAHFERFARDVKTRYLRVADPLVVEIGCNDGILLRHFAREGVRHVGVEPSAGVAKAAQAQGVRTLCCFFEKDAARRIVEENGQADAILAANVMCHIPYFHSIADGVDLLLKPDGVMCFEDPYLGDIIGKTSYDQIYDEHVFFFSVTSVNYAFGLHGMEVIDVWPQKPHGGSMRYCISRKGAHRVSEAVLALAEKERAAGLNRPGTYSRFRSRCDLSRGRLRSLLEDIRRRGKRVIGYAATSKSTTVTNYCGLTPDLIEFISDTTPLKHGKFSPGAHIPVLPYEKFSERYPDYALLFGWNHKDEILAKEQSFAKAGGRWIVYVPEVAVLQ